MIKKLLPIFFVLLAASPAWAISSHDRKAVRYDTVFYDPSGGGGSSSDMDVSPADTSSNENVKLGQELARELKGWTGREFDCLYELWQGESNWNEQADNPTSTAYGIPQALLSVHKENIEGNYPGYFTGPYEKPTGGDAKVQIRWGLDYIMGRYDTPCNALAMWRERGRPENGGAHWY